MMSYYLSDRPQTFLPNENYGKSHNLWPSYDRTNSDALRADHGRPMTRFRIYLCTRE